MSENMVDVLVVDDRPENLMAMESLLQSDELNVVKASSGDEALNLVRKHDFALVLMDVQMPEMDGFETAELIRGRKKTRHLPIIFVTAISKEQTHVFKGYESGAVDYLFMPLDPLILKSKVSIFVQLYQQRKDLEDSQAALDAINRRLEDLVRERTLVLEEKSRELKVANKRLVELDAMKSAFLSSVSHELRTPLTSIMGFAKLINRDFLKNFSPLGDGMRKLEKKSKRISKNLGIIASEGERLTRLINDVLDLNKIETGRMEWNDSLVSPIEVVKHAVDVVSGLFMEKPHVKLIVRAPDDLPSLVIDEDKLAQVLINLLNNAEKFTREGTVFIEVSKTSLDRMLFKVSDSGVGIPQEYLDKVFAKFIQVAGDTLVKKPAGTGLGLTICREIVEHYNGEIWVESTEGVGSTFFFELPIPQQGLVRSLTQQKSGEEKKQAGAAEGEEAPLILVVDDDHSINAYLSELLEGEGFSVVSAYDGETAVELARELRPDCISMDIMMPIMDGKSAIDLLRAEPATNDIPVVVVSVLADSSENFGGDATLGKPIDDDKLISTITGLVFAHNAQETALMLCPDGADDPSCQIHNFTGRVIPCDEQDFFTRIGQGFKGTVMVPASIVKALDLAGIVAIKNISVLVLPDVPTD